MENCQVAVRGTDAWAAPELSNGGRATAKSDIYSYGLVVHFMASGEKHDGARVSYRRELHRSWVDLMKACLARQPEQRPSHSGVLARIAKLTEHPMASRTPPTTPTAR